jgi:YesN/AraC family two-component response regulator
MIFFEKHGVEDKEFFRLVTLRNFSFPLHFHVAFEIIYVNNGCLTITIDQKEYHLQKNDLAFVFPNQIHEFITEDNSQIKIILFSPELIGDFFMNYKGSVPTDNILHLDMGLNDGRLATTYSQKSFLYYICDQLVQKKVFIKTKKSTQTKLLHKIILYVEQNYSSDFTLKDVAKKLQYDYPYISKLFAKQMDITFTKYLNNYRVSQACYLLKNSEQSIGDIAVNCGYNNLKTFHRNFIKITNLSPKVYRLTD